MKYELAESILKEVMVNWKEDRVAEELNDIQVIAEIKYDDYQQYTYGMRYVESLGLWLRQFAPEDRETAYRFVKAKLIYISDAEMLHLVECSYTLKMKEYLLNDAKDFCKKAKINNVEEKKHIYNKLRRQSLFLGLSDGAHIDFFRRRNSQLSNEQVFVHYDFSEEKASDMLKELRKDLGDENIKFTSFFLIDDFSASGKSYIRRDKKGWHGKIHKFFEQLEKVLYNTDNIKIHLLTYVSTEKALQYMRDNVREYFTNKNVTNVTFTIDTIQLVTPLDMDSEAELNQLLKKNYDERIRSGKKSFEDKHFEVGEGKVPYWGFADCALPVVLFHNTPNDSFPVLWYSWGDSVNALFPRVTRHKEI